MQKISNVLVLRRGDIARLANFVWRAALILFGLKFIIAIVASILFVCALREPGMEAHRYSAFGGSIAELSSAATILLQLLAVRFAVEVGVRLVGEQKS